MSKKLAVSFAALFLMASSAAAEEMKLSIGKDDSIWSVLSKQVGKRVSLTLDSGQEMAGSVRSVSTQVVHLGELTGKEFYDGIVSLDDIAAVVVRVK